MMSKCLNKQVFIGAGVVLVAIIITLVWVASGSESPDQQLATTTETQPEPIEPQPDPDQAQIMPIVDPLPTAPTPIPPPASPDQNQSDSGINQPGLYVDWQGAGYFDRYKQKQRWLNFHADWCPQCVSLDNDIQANLDQIPADVVIFKVDYDNSPDLKKRYDVTIQTTAVAVDAAGDKIKSEVLYSDPTLTTLIESLSD